MREQRRTSQGPQLDTRILQFILQVDPDQDLIFQNKHKLLLLSFLTIH